MSCLLFLISNPIWLILLILLGSLSIILPSSAGAAASLGVAAAPVVTIILATTWLDRVSNIFQQVGPSLKQAVVAILILGLLDHESYYLLIASSIHSLSDLSRLDFSILLSLSSSALLFASLITLLIVGLTLLAEMSVRLVIGNQSQDFSRILEGLRFIFFITIALLSASSILELLVKNH